MDFKTDEPWYPQWVPSGSVVNEGWRVDQGLRPGRKAEWQDGISTKVSPGQQKGSLNGGSVDRKLLEKMDKLTHGRKGPQLAVHEVIPQLLVIEMPVLLNPFIILWGTCVGDQLPEMSKSLSVPCSSFCQSGWSRARGNFFPNRDSRVGPLAHCLSSSVVGAYDMFSEGWTLFFFMLGTFIYIQIGEVAETGSHG